MQLALKFSLAFTLLIATGAFLRLLWPGLPGVSDGLLLAGLLALVLAVSTLGYRDGWQNNLW